MEEDRIIALCRLLAQLNELSEEQQKQVIHRVICQYVQWLIAKKQE